MTRAGLLAAVSAFILLAAVTPAQAAHVQCGDTITVDTKLDSDVVCTNPTATSVGVFIGAGDVTLHLGQHSIRGPGGEGVGVVTSGTVTGGHPNVQVRGGTIEGFSEGASIHGHDSVVQGLSVTGINAGITMQGDRNTVLLNDVEVTREAARGDGVRMDGDDAYATRNTVTGKPQRAIFVDGENSRVVVNTVQACDPAIGTSGIEIQGYADFAMIARNVVGACSTSRHGILVTSASDAPGGAAIHRNEVTANDVGIQVDDPSARLWRNTANGNIDAGILIGLPGNLVQENVANNNSFFGISAPPGTIDGGGNTATGNGTNCVNVAC
jgi:hypothetical protein